jgi:tetratricopeptide (TPR) repeat protein
LRPSVLLLSVALSVAVTAVAISVEAASSELEDGVRLFNDGDYEGAHAIFTDLHKRGLKDSDIPYYLGRLCMVSNDFEQAVRYFEEAIERDDARSSYHRWLAVALARRIPYSGFLSRMRNSMKMMRELDRAIDLDPGNLDARIIRAGVFIRSYGKAPVSRDDVLAEIGAVAAIDSAMGYKALGDYYHLVEGDDSLAKANFSRAFELKPNNAQVVMSLADWHWAAGRRQDAVGLLRALWDQDPKTLEVGYELAVKMMLGGQDPSQALAVLKKCLDLRSESGMPSIAMVHWALAAAYRLEGDPQAAQQEWHEVKALDREFDKLLKNSPDLQELEALLTND